MNKLFFLKETAPRINLEEATLRQYVKRGKISSLKDKRGRHMFTEKEIIRFKDNRKRLAEEIKDHFSLEELEIMGISKSLVIDGVIESKIVERKYYVHFKELKRYLKTINKCSTLTSQVCEKDLQVFNRGGLHCRPSAKIIKICNEHVDKGLAVKISYKNKAWLFPSMGIFELTELCVYRLETVRVRIEGGGAIFCMRDLEEAFKKEFDIKY